MEYKNLHHYLDVRLGEITQPTSEQIQEAKREYWKLWYKYYRRKRRQKFKEITLHIDKETLRRLTLKKGSATISEFVYNTLFNALGQHQRSVGDRELLKELDHHLMQLIDQLDGLLQSDNPIIPEAVLIGVEDIANRFTEFLNDM